MKQDLIVYISTDEGRRPKKPGILYWEPATE